ncbi:hypothetical protein [Paenibacillus cellulositrophicus]|uniref:hypothetical protein n=1 Tax=Paenibacillus cellulositrophicus TaxID=562959 RepID=UPI003D99E087
MEPRLRVNLETKELYYDYILQDTFEAKVAALQQENTGLKAQIDLMQKALDDVILGGAL